MLLAVDPGIRHCGVALFRQGVLERACLARNPSRHGHGVAECLDMVHTIIFMSAHVTSYVFEWPQVYTKGPGDPNDLLPLVGIGVALATHFANARAVSPHEWKGSTDKKVMNERVLARLAEPEKLKIESAGALTHNILDAVGIGLYHLDRLERKRVIAR